MYCNIKLIDINVFIIVDISYFLTMVTLSMSSI